MEKETVEIAVRRFLRNGYLGGTDPHDMAAACDKEIQRCARTSVRSALQLARRFDRQAAGYGGVMSLTASRTLARYLHMSGHHKEALQAYSRARLLAGKEPIIRARIDRALIDIYMYLGEFSKAKGSATAAMRSFKRLNAQNDLMQTQVNLANLLHRLDRHGEAEEMYADAARHFEKSGNQLAAARCHFNRANTLVQLVDWAEAERLYTRAMKVYDEEGFSLDANDARYGLAWLRMLGGEFHTALLDLSTCEQIYRDGGDPRGEALCTLDRAEAFVNLGLYADARESATAAELQFRKLGLRYEKSKAALFRAQAAFALRSRAEALRACKRATEGFRADNNRRLLAAAHLIQSDLYVKDRKARISYLRRARSVFSKASLPAWNAVCDLKLVHNVSGVDAAFGRLAANPAVRHIPHLYALWQTALGDRMIQKGRKTSARRHWRNAARRLDTVKAKLPPFELRTAYGGNLDSPHVRLIELELQRHPRDAAAWSEKYKTAGVWSPLPATDESDPQRKQVQTSLDRLAQQVGTLAYRISDTAPERNLPASTTDRALLRLQGRVREAMIVAEKDHDSVMENLDWFSGYLTDVSITLPVVQFHVQKSDIIAFVHVGAETYVRRYGDGRKRLSDLMSRWRFIIESELLAGHFGQKADMSLEAALCEEAGNWLWQPLEISSDKRDVLILPEGDLANIPWRALLVGGERVSDRHSFVLSPSMTHYRAASNVSPESHAVELFQGVADSLRNTAEELESIAARFGRQSKIHSPCYRDDWPSTGDFRFWHFAGHATLRSDNPFYSYLALDDGPLFAADFRLRNCKVRLATLAACRSGQHIALPGEEATGLVRSLLEMGARNVVASHWPVSDLSSRIWMDAFYDHLSRGDSLLTAADFACETVREKQPSAYHWAAYSVFGAGALGE